MDIVVVVWGEKITVTVEQQSKTVWRATGTYMGETFQTKDRSAKTAAARWRDLVEYRGD